MTTKYIVAARIDENGNITGGKAGDQTGSEVMVQTLSSSGSWTYILRPPACANKIVKQSYAAAENDHIGYDQNQRTTLYVAAADVLFDLAKIKTDCECDCSALVAVICNCAGYDVSKDMYTGNERELLKAQGFEEIAYKSTALEPGDVLWRDGHTGIYVGTSKTWTEPSSSDALEVDGLMGPLTVAALYRAAGLSEKKALDAPNEVVKWLQQLVGAEIDGYWGHETTTKLQRLLGTVVDGEIWSQAASNAPILSACTSGWIFVADIKAEGSPCICELQRRLNAGTLV